MFDKDQKISRRQFLKGAGIASLGVAATALGGAAAHFIPGRESTQPQTTLPQNETDQNVGIEQLVINMQLAEKKAQREIDAALARGEKLPVRNYFLEPGKVYYTKQSEFTVATNVEQDEKSVSDINPKGDIVAFIGNGISPEVRIDTPLIPFEGTLQQFVGCLDYTEAKLYEGQEQERRKHNESSSRTYPILSLVEFGTDAKNNGSQEITAKSLNIWIDKFSQPQANSK